MHEVEVKLSAMHLGGRKRVLYYAILKLILQETCASSFCTFYGEICSIPKNVTRFLKNAFHIPEEHHLGLASLFFIYILGDDVLIR